MLIFIKLHVFATKVKTICVLLQKAAAAFLTNRGQPNTYEKC